MIFGQPDQWLALLIESLLVAGAGARPLDRAARARLRGSASHGGDDRRPAVLVIADADSRIGPVLEAVINGRYLLGAVLAVAENRLRETRGSARHGLGCRRTSSSRTAASPVAFIPTRYPGSEASTTA